MVENRPDTRGRTRLAVQKVHSSDTGALSSISVKFSALGWNRVTVEYLKSVQQLDVKKLRAIFDLAKGLVQKGQQLECDADESHSGRATLCSDEENW